MLSRNVFWIVLIASAAMISDARTARAFQMPIRCPFYAPNGDIVRCADYQAFANAHREYQSAKGHAGSWGCRAISGTVGGRTWGMASRAEAASGAIAACGHADCHILKCSALVQTPADAQAILVDNSSRPGWHLRQ
jgi:hypothetical protein